MTDHAEWQHANERFLSAALAWLRLRLERAAAQAPSPPGETDAALPPSDETPRRRFFRRRAEAAAEKPRAPLLLLPASVPDAQVEEAEAAMNDALGSSPPPALALLAQRFGLSAFERHVLLLCAATELDTSVGPLCEMAKGGWGSPHPTFALALTLFDDPAWDVLSPERPLRYWRMIEITQQGATPLTTSPLSADEWVVNYIKGLNYIDDRLSPLLIPLEAPAAGAELPPSQREQVEAVVRAVLAATPSERLPVVQLLGPDAPSKRLVAWHAAAALNLNLYRMPVRLLPPQAAELETLARLWQRQSLLLPVSLYLDAHESAGAPTAEGQEAPALPPLNRFLTRSDGVFFLDTRDVWPRLDRASLLLDVNKPTPAEQQAAWADALGGEAGEEPARLAGQFNLSLAEIRRVASEAAVAGAGPPAGLGERLWRACLRATRPRLDALAQRLDPVATWDDIVLPDAEVGLLRQIADHIRQRSTVYDDWGFRRKMNRGLGISALFAGQSGTGKTMAAEVIANELRLNLYRIDLSAVISKYIGETEKNLRRLFDAAEDGGTILFFDEADAIFGKRSEVKDSHDRYANIEINYLLQRMEAYGGLAVLATNMKSALDTAFMRRLRFVVNFPVPAEAERRLMWEKVFPPEVPTAGLDCDRLARLNLTGGHIHNVALNAAFLAARAGLPVTMPVVLDAARTEFRKLDRPINEADFRWQEPAGARVA
ncbi:MAG TPA: ATP-binding protein [Pyrinomonadaceae bacterium]|nr:ATP-binding protein [Pyrinomonadaceae bacterium]